MTHPEQESPRATGEPATAGDTTAPGPFPTAAQPSAWARPDAYPTDAFASPRLPDGAAPTADQQPSWAHPGAAAAPTVPQPPGYQPPGGFAAPVPPHTAGAAFGYPPTYPYGNPYAYPVHRPTDGMAIASLAVACVGLLGLCAYGLGGVLGLVGAILGHVARRRVRRSGADGSGMATAGIIIGWSVVGISVLVVALILAVILTDRTIWTSQTD